MGKVIAFISRKGGVGKTTLAVHLAAQWHHMGHSVTLLETDPNYTVSTLREMEKSRHGKSVPSGFAVEAGRAEQTSARAAELAKENDILIIDCAGKTTDKETRAVCLMADLVIVPTSLAQNDLIVTFQTLKDIKEALKKNKALSIRVLPNRLNSRTKQENVAQELALLNTEIFSHFVPSRSRYTQFSTLAHDDDFKPLAEEILKAL